MSKCVFSQCKTSVAHNSASIKHRAMSFMCSMGFPDTADRMARPPSLTCDQRWPSVIKCADSRVVGLRLQDSLVVYAICFRFPTASVLFGTRPPTLRGTAKWAPAFGLTSEYNNDEQWWWGWMIAAYACSLTAQPWRFDQEVGSGITLFCIHKMNRMNSSNNCHDDDTINIVPLYYCIDCIVALTQLQQPSDIMVQGKVSGWDCGYRTLPPPPDIIPSDISPRYLANR